MVEWLAFSACCSPSRACRDNSELPEHRQQGPTGSSYALTVNDNKNDDDGGGDTDTAVKGRATRHAAFVYSPSTWGTEDHASTSVAMSLTQCARYKNPLDGLLLLLLPLGNSNE